MRTQPAPCTARIAIAAGLLREVPLTSYFLLLTSYFLLPASYFLLPTSYFLLPTSYFLLPTSYFLLPTSYFLIHLVTRTEHAEQVGAKALERSVVQDDARVRCSRRDLSGSATGAEVDWSKRVTHLARPVTDVGCAARPKLAYVTPSKAFERTVVQDDARV